MYDTCGETDIPDRGFVNSLSVFYIHLCMIHARFLWHLFLFRFQMYLMYATDSTARMVDIASVDDPVEDLYRRVCVHREPVV